MENTFPYVKGGGGVAASKAYNETSLELMDRLIGHESVVKAQVYTLLLFSGATNEVFHPGRTFIVQHVHTRLDSPLGEVLEEFFCCSG